MDPSVAWLQQALTAGRAANTDPIAQLGNDAYMGSGPPKQLQTGSGIDPRDIAYAIQAMSAQPTTSQAQAQAPVEQVTELPPPNMAPKPVKAKGKAAPQIKAVIPPVKAGEEQWNPAEYQANIDSGVGVGQAYNPAFTPAPAEPTSPTTSPEDAAFMQRMQEMANRPAGSMLLDALPQALGMFPMGQGVKAVGSAANKVPVGIEALKEAFTQQLMKGNQNLPWVKARGAVNKGGHEYNIP